MNIKNTIYSIITGILIFSAPTYAIDTEDAKEATGFLGQIFSSLSWNSVKNCGPIVAAIGGTYGVYWCYSKYNYHRNLHQPNIKQTKKLVYNSKKINNQLDNSKNQVDYQKNIIDSINQQNNKNEKLVKEQISSVINAFKLATLNNNAKQINENQQKINNNLDRASKASKENLDKIGAIHGVFATLGKQAKKQDIWQKTYLNNTNNDLNEVSIKAKQSNEHLYKAHSNLDTANTTMKNEPNVFKQQLKENRKKQQKEKSQKFENCRQNQILNVTPLIPKPIEVK